MYLGEIEQAYARDIRRRARNDGENEYVSAPDHVFDEDEPQMQVGRVLFNVGDVRAHDYVTDYLNDRFYATEPNYEEDPSGWVLWNDSWNSIVPAWQHRHDVYASAREEMAREDRRNERERIRPVKERIQRIAAKTNAEKKRRRQVYDGVRKSWKEKTSSKPKETNRSLVYPTVTFGWRAHPQYNTPDSANVSTLQTYAADKGSTTAATTSGKLARKKSAAKKGRV